MLSEEGNTSPVLLLRIEHLSDSTGNWLFHLSESDQSLFFDQLVERSERRRYNVAPALNRFPEQFVGAVDVVHYSNGSTETLVEPEQNRRN